MSLRHFTDSSGTEWTVYDVVPRLDDRRMADRRDASHVAEESPLDRRGEDRRATISSVHPVRITRGWLCFESKEERRRLQPIPSGWLGMPEAELVKILEHARVVPRRPMRRPDVTVDR